VKEYTIEDFERILPVYTDIVKHGKESKMIDGAHECLVVMEYFEEYEKCMDLIPFIGEEDKPSANNSVGQIENN